MVSEIDFPDVNVWVALSLPHHEAHGRAKQYFESEAAPQLRFHPVTALGLARVTSHLMRPVWGQETCARSWNLLRDWFRQPQTGWQTEPDSAWVVLSGLVSHGVVQPRTWTEAYLAAVAMTSGLRLITFDRGFARFPALEALILD